MHTSKELPTRPLHSVRYIERPPSPTVTDLESPATEILTDFNRQTPLMLEQGTSIDEAREMMRKTHVKLKLVIDAQEEFRGVISLEDLVSVKVMEAMSQTGLPRNELTVAHVMTPRSRLRAIDFDDFSHATVGDILATMQKYGEQHVLVVDTQRESVRGIVSANDIARRMHIPVVISERANSFSDIYRAVRG